MWLTVTPIVIIYDTHGHTKRNKKETNSTGPNSDRARQADWKKANDRHSLRIRQDHATCKCFYEDPGA